MGKKLITIISLTIIILVNSSCFSFLDLGVCENTAEKEVVSPNGKSKAVIFDRGCGATVGFITGISVISTDEKIPNTDMGNILFASNVYREFSYENEKIEYGKTNFDVEWVDDEKLKVFYTHSKILNKNDNFENIKVEYELIK